MTLGPIVASIIFGFTLGVFFSVAMAGLGAEAILYTTSNILHYYRTDQYAAAATALFAASVALMFWYVLRILITARRENAHGGEELK